MYKNQYSDKFLIFDLYKTNNRGGMMKNNRNELVSRMDNLLSDIKQDGYSQKFTDIANNYNIDMTKSTKVLVKELPLALASDDFLFMIAKIINKISHYVSNERNMLKTEEIDLNMIDVFMENLSIAKEKVQGEPALPDFDHAIELLEELKNMKRLMSV